MKRPKWLPWESSETKSDHLKKVRQQTDQRMKQQEVQKEEGEKTQLPLHRLRYRPPGAVGPSIAAAVATNSGLGDAHDLRDLRDRFAVEVDEVDDLAALR